MLRAGWAAMTSKEGTASDTFVVRAARISRLDCSSCLPAVKLRASSPSMVMTSEEGQTSEVGQTSLLPSLMLSGPHHAVLCSHIIYKPPQARLKVDSLPHDCQGGHGVN